MIYNIKPIVKKIIYTLAEDNHTIAFAESCTGGRVASEFTSISGVSSVLNGSCITYSNNIKHLWLGVKEETLESLGAVSYECVEEMLYGIKNMALSDYAIAISGIAGPTGSTVSKPVGTVYIGIITPTELSIKLYHFRGGRLEVQNKATQKAIKNLFKMLNL
ncbi:MAG: CinA family protein [Sulfurovum sp.]|nr:CinA family protein [Sulfurovaceae bacterium]